MSESLSPLDMIRANAEMVLAVARDDFGQDIGFDAPGVRWLDGYIQRLHDQGDVADAEPLSDRLGAYLGECIIQAYGGAWQQTEHGWAVVMDRDLAVFPFNKTHKHLVDGAGDSVLSLFNSIPALMAHATGTESEVAPPDDNSKSLIGRIGNLFRRR